MKKAIITCLSLVVVVGAQANLFKDGFLDHNSNNMNYDHIDVGWNIKAGWSTSENGLVHQGPVNNAGGQVGQVFAVNSGSDTGNVAILSFDWSPAGAPNAATTLEYQLIGWNEVSSATSGDFFKAISWGGPKVGTLVGTHERVDLINGGAGSTVDNVNMAENTVTVGLGSTTNYSITVDLNNLAAGISDFSDYEYVGIRFGIPAADTNTIDSAIENISLTLSNAVVVVIPTVTGTFIDTTFANTAIYSNGDLATQDNWEANVSTEADAFNVNVAGDGFAEGLASTAKTNGAVVYWSEATSNGVGSVWSGTTKFSVSAANAPTVARPGDGALIADFNDRENYPIFGLGISSDVETSNMLEAHPSSGLGYTKEAVIRAWFDDNGTIKFGLNDRFHGTASLLTLNASQLGWNPLTTDTNVAPDFLTEQIECEWTIRKSTVINDYNATLTATVGTNVYEGSIQYNVDGPENLWGSATASFAMQHVVDATDLLDVSVDAISVTHTNSSEIPKSVPSGLVATTGDLSIDLKWSTAGGEESGGFDIYRSTTGTDAEDFSFYINSAATSFTDSGLEDTRVYSYKIKGVFSTGDSDFSELIAARALAQVPVDGLQWGVNPGIFGNDWDMSLGTASTLNGIDLYTGGGVDGSFASSVSNITANGTYNTTIAPLVYGWVQMDEGEGINQTRFNVRSGDDLIRFRDNDGDATTNASLIYVKVDSPVNLSSEGLKMKSGEWGNNTRAAVRNNGIWYASSTITDNSVQSLNLATETWAVFSEPSTGEAFVDVTGESFSARTFDQVDAVGILRGKNVDTVNTTHAMWQLTVGSKASAFEDWAASFGVYNEDAAGTFDYDNDGIDNVTEWGLGGDPADPTKWGLQARRQAMGASGNFLYIYPRLITASRPVYTIGQDTNLQYAPEFEDNILVDGADFTETFGGTWGTNTFQSQFESVTNEIFSTASEDMQFFKLIITE